MAWFSYSLSGFWGSLSLTSILECYIVRLLLRNSGSILEQTKRGKRDAMLQNNLSKGIAIMLSSSLLTCTGQLCWKLSTGQNAMLFLLAGFGLHSCGALLMITALRYGDLSKLHPLLSAGYILSVILGSVVLNEPVTGRKIAGIAVIIVDLVLINLPERLTIRSQPLK